MTERDFSSWMWETAEDFLDRFQRLERLMFRPSASGAWQPPVDMFETDDSLWVVLALPGVGRKTANVVLGNAFGIPALAVDTHVFRVSQRLGLARADDPEEVHDQLCMVLPKPRWTQASHLLILHGRRVCFARKPACPTCPVLALCPWPDKTPAVAAPSARRGRTGRRS